MPPVKTKTSVGLETPGQTLGRARDLLSRSRAATAAKPPASTANANPRGDTTAVDQSQASAMSTADLSRRLAASPITTPVQPDQITPSSDVSLPEPNAFNVQSEYVTSATENVNRYRQSLDSQLDSRRAEIDTEKQRLEKERDKLMKEGVAPNLDPFREDLEKTERKRLKVEENYFANQKLTDEFDTLLTQGNQLIEQQRALPVHQSVVSGRVNNTLRDVNARAGVIEAVMAARNNQISQAYTLIDRSVNAITADRNDQLSYYETLINLNQQDILKLDKEDEKLANEQITLAKSDLERAQATADYIKEKMINPETAQFMAEAGVTLMDSVEEINIKLAAETGRREVEDTKNAYVEQGYEYVPFPTPGARGLTTVEINGQQLTFKVRPGSELALRLEAQQANIAQSYASAAASRTNRLLALAEAGDPNAIKSLGFDPAAIANQSTIDVAAVVNNPLSTSFDKNSAVVTALLSPNSKIGGTARTGVSSMLGVLNSLDELADARVGGKFAGFNPLRPIVDAEIPFTNIPLIPFRNSLKREETIKNEGYLDAINLKVQQWASGASLTEQQTEQVNKLVPQKSDTDRIVRTKMNNLANFMMTQVKSTLQSEGINFTPESINLFETMDLLEEVSPEQAKQLQDEGLI